MPPDLPLHTKTIHGRTIRYNATFAEKADALLPVLHHDTVKAQGTTTFEPDSRAYFGVKRTKQHAISDLETKTWGKDEELILDFGDHLVGYLKFFLDALAADSHVDAPARLRLTFGETPLDVTEDLYPCNTWISTSWLPVETITVDFMPAEVAVPRRHAFRFVRVQVLDTSRRFRVKFSNIRVDVVSAVSLDQARAVSPLPDSDDLLRRIDSVSMTTLRNCMQTVFEDGPRRDRRLWIGDLRLQALTNYCTFGQLDLVKRCLYLFAAVPRDDGSLPACLYEQPTLIPGCDYIVDYDVLFGSIVLDYVKVSGDVATGEELWQSVLNSTTTPLQHVKSGVFKGDSTSAWKFLDWAEDLHKDAGMQGVVIVGLKAVNELATLLGKPTPFEAVVAEMINASKAAFWDDAAAVWVSGEQKQVSWASQAWMALAGVLDREGNKKALLTVMASPDTVKPLTPYLYHQVAEALCEVGAPEECLRLIREYWGGMVEAGADTFWECYDPKDPRSSPYGDCHNNSYCHAWSCTPSYLLRVKLRGWLDSRGS